MVLTVIVDTQGIHRRFLAESQAAAAVVAPAFERAAECVSISTAIYDVASFYQQDALHSHVMSLTGQVLQTPVVGPGWRSPVPGKPWQGSTETQIENTQERELLYCAWCCTTPVDLKLQGRRSNPKLTEQLAGTTSQPAVCRLWKPACLQSHFAVTAPKQQLH
jgi:hypothetical protein